MDEYLPFVPRMGSRMSASFWWIHRL